MTLIHTPCDWEIIWPDCGSEPCEGSPITQLTAEVAEYVEQMAVERLWRWTGRVLGVCEVTISPCAPGCGGASTWAGNGPIPGASTAAVLVGGGGCCTCPASDQLTLPGPTVSVVSVVEEGVTLPAEAYRLDTVNDLLIRLDGGTWPACNPCDTPAGDPGTWEVTYRRGVPVPVGGRVAAGVLATEYAKALCGDSTCRLPQRVQTITRQGVTVGMLDDFDGLEDGKTGIWIIDDWVASRRYPEARPRVYSPDLPRRA